MAPSEPSLSYRRVLESCRADFAIHAGMMLRLLQRRLLFGAYPHPQLANSIRCGFPGTTGRAAATPGANSLECRGSLCIFIAGSSSSSRSVLSTLVDTSARLRVLSALTWFGCTTREREHYTCALFGAVLRLSPRERHLIGSEALDLVVSPASLRKQTKRLIIVIQLDDSILHVKNWKKQLLDNNGDFFKERSYVLMA